MSNPSFSNIDQWLFEYAEGNLSETQIEQLKLFLLLHPEYDVDKDMWENAHVEKEAVVYPDQEKLKRKRPIGWIFFGSAASLLVLISVGAIIFSSSDLASKSQLAADDERQGVNRKLEMEINALKVQLKDLSKDGRIENERLHIGSTVKHAIPANYQSFNNGENKESVSALAIDLNDLDTKDVATLLHDEMDLVPIDLKTKSATTIETSFNSKKIDKSHSSISSTVYKISLRSRINSFSRAMQRMLDNPVALKNFRDPQFLVPAMLANDVSFSSAGAMLSTRVQSLSRLQWYGQENQQLMNQVAIDGYVFALRGGLGIQLNHGLYNDGGVSVASAAITYSPKFSISRKISVEPALRFKMGNKSLDYSKLNGVKSVEINRGDAKDFYADGSKPIGSELWYKEVGVGLMVNTEWFYVGAQLDNLFRYNDNIYSNNYDNPERSNYHFVANIGTDWVSRKETFGLSPYVVYQNMGNISEAWVGANARLHWLTFGAAMSTSFDPVASIGMKFKHFSLCYNADYSLSDMTGIRSLSHQVSLKFVTKPSRFGKRLLNL